MNILRRCFFLIIATLILTEYSHSQIRRVFPFYESFDDFDLCGTSCGDTCDFTSIWWSNARNDVFDWTVNEGGTPTGNTGPNGDHTSGVGRYVYTETSGNTCQTSTAHILSPLLDLSYLPNCFLDFWYHMRGQNMGVLTIDVSRNNGATWDFNVIPFLTSNNNNWQRRTVDLSTYAGDTVLLRFRTISGNGGRGDMALDDLLFYFDVGTDVSPWAMLSPETEVCADSLARLTVSISNNGRNTVSNVSVTAIISGARTDTLTGILAGPIPSRSLDTLDLGVLNTYNGGNFNITLITSYPGDTFPINDTLVESIFINGYPDPPQVNLSAQPCAGFSSTMNISNPFPGATYGWFNGPTSTTPLDTGLSFTTPPLTVGSLTYYVQGNPAERAQVGPSDNNFGLGGNLNNFGIGLEFDVLKDCILESVAVYPNGSGNITVELTDAAGNVLNSATVTAGSSGQKQIVPLNFSIPAGADYELKPTGSTLSALYRNNFGGNYPYRSSLINITNATTGSTVFYYYFYDWLVKELTCEGPRVPVTIQVVPGAPTAAFNFSIGGNGNTVSFQNQSSDTTGIVWDFGDGNSSQLVNPIHTYQNYGTYTVCMISSNGCGADTTCSTFTLCPPVTAAFNFTSNKLTVNFVNSSTDTSFVAWDFGDGNTASVASPSHTFTTDGAYTVCMRASSGPGCPADTFCQTITVCAPIAGSFIAQPSGNLLDYTFSGSTTSGTGVNWFWDFGDGNTGTGASITHTYAGNNNYTVTLIVINQCGDRDTVTQAIMVMAGNGLPAPALLVRLSPNPTTGPFQLEVNSPVPGPATLEVFSLNGQRLFQRNWHLHAGYSLKSFSPDLPTGTYMLWFSLPGDTKFRKLMLIH